MIKKCVVFLLVITVTLTIASTCLATEPKEFVEQFFDKIKAGKITEGYDGLFAGSGISVLKPQAFQMLKMQTAAVLPVYGSILGFEKIREEKFGASLVRLVYILKSENGPTIWEFYFYKPRTNWFCDNVFFNDEFGHLERKE